MDKRNLELALELRHELHRHPELSYMETETVRRILDFLRANTKNLEIVDRGRWLYAAYDAGPGKPAIAFRADFDAVMVLETCDVPWKSENPGVAHKCGHDGHVASLAAYALEVDQNGADKSVYFLFQHAEETGQGAIECQALITEKNIDEIYGYHNLTGFAPFAVCTRDEIMNCASRGMSVFFTGKPAHAGEPEAGISPVSAVAELALGVPEIVKGNIWQEMVMSTTVNLNVGGEAFGVAPGDGVARFTLRAVLESELNRLSAEIEAHSRALADKYGLAVRFEYRDSFPETRNHKKCADKIRAAARELGMEVEEKDEPLRGSEDFGYYTKLIPGAMFWIGNPLPTPLHSNEYDFPDEHIEHVVRIYKKLTEYPI